MIDYNKMLHPHAEFDSAMCLLWRVCTHVSSTHLHTHVWVLKIAELAR
jgi:hypothetical protein